VDGDLQKFKKIAVEIDKAVVLLESQGGQTYDALEIGKIIKIKGYSTYVGNETTCASSCALIWLSGTSKYMGRNAKLGFHAAYLETDGSKKESGLGNAIVGSYLNSMGISDKAIIFATQAGPNSISWLTPEIADGLGINVNIIEDDKVAANTNSQTKPSRTPNIEANNSTHYGNYGYWSIDIDKSLNNGCFIFARFDGGTALRIGYDMRPEASFYITVADSKWSSISKDKKYQIAMRLNKKSPEIIEFGATKMDDDYVLYTHISAGKLAEILESDDFAISYNGNLVAHLAPKGQSGAFEAARACQGRQPD
jgi:hypothetical protein